MFEITIKEKLIAFIDFPSLEKSRVEELQNLITPSPFQTQAYVYQEAETGKSLILHAIET